MAGPLDEAVPGELRDEGDDEENLGFSRHPLLLRLSRSLASQKPVYVWLLKPKGRPPQRKNLPAPIQQKL